MVGELFDRFEHFPLIDLGADDRHVPVGLELAAIKRDAVDVER